MKPLVTILALSFPLLVTHPARATCPPPQTDVELLSPANLSSNRPENTSIFMGGPGLSAVQTAKLSTSGGSPIVGTQSGVPGLTIFQPGQLLSPNTTYHVAVVDFSDVVLASGDFTTGTAQDQTYPTPPGDPVAVVSTSYDFGNPDPSCPTPGGWPVTVTWTPATDDNPLVYALQAGLGNVALTVSYSTTNARLATFEAPASSHVLLLLRAFDGSLHENQSNQVPLDTMAAPPTPTPSPTATPGSPSSGKGGCSCELGGTASTFSVGGLLAAAFLAVRLLAVRRRRDRATPVR